MANLPQFHRRISLGFTAMIFVLILLEGTLFLFADYIQDIKRAEDNTALDATQVISAIDNKAQLSSVILPPIARNRARLFDKEGIEHFKGTIFVGREPSLEQKPWMLEHTSNVYRVLTFPIYDQNDITGYLQMGERFLPLEDRLLSGIPIILLLSIAFSFIVYTIGLWFQKYSMRPAFDMFNRLEQFAHDAGHELRTPLASARSSLEIAKKADVPDQYIDDAIEDIDSITHLTDALIELTTLTGDSLRKEPVDVTALAEEALKSLRDECRKQGVKCIETLEPNVTRLADGALLKVVIRNFAHNALKFTPKGGTVRITLTPDYVSIRDTGIGMTPDVTEKIFNRFFQADPSRSKEGFGLGLTIAKRIIDLHGWQVTVRSTPNVGSTFTLWFDEVKRKMR